MASQVTSTSPSHHFFYALPGVISNEILNYLSMSDLVKAGHSSSALKALSNNNRIWEAHGKREFPEEYNIEVVNAATQQSNLTEIRGQPFAKERVHRAALANKQANSNQQGEYLMYGV